MEDPSNPFLSIPYFVLQYEINPYLESIDRYHFNQILPRDLRVNKKFINFDLSNFNLEVMTLELKSRVENIIATPFCKDREKKCYRLFQRILHPLVYENFFNEDYNENTKKFFLSTLIQKSDEFIEEMLKNLDQKKVSRRYAFFFIRTCLKIQKKYMCVLDDLLYLKD
jgi:hypothetical protein